MKPFTSARPARAATRGGFTTHVAATLLSVLLLSKCYCGRQLQAAEPHFESTQLQPWSASPRAELHRLLVSNAAPSQLLPFAEQLHLAGRLQELGSGGLPWAGWTGPGWRWETRLPGGARVVLATDGLVLVAIREGRVLEFSVLDLTVGGGMAEARTRSSGLLVNRTAVEHITAASAADMARKAPDLFPMYYYFAGPTAEIVSSHLLPRPMELAPIR